MTRTSKMTLTLTRESQSVETGRVKCYHCGGRFPEESTRLHKVMAGGSYKRASSPRWVRACYRCIAHEAYKSNFQLCRMDREKMIERGWALAEDFYNYGYGWEYFAVLWPPDALQPPVPTSIPSRYLPLAEQEGP